MNIDEKSGTDELVTALYEGKHFLEKYGFNISISIGEEKEGMMYIHQSYKEAVYALKYTYLLGTEDIIFYEDVGNREFQHLTSSENRLLNKVLDFIKGKEEMTATQFVADVMEEYGVDENVSIDTIEFFQYEIIGVINRAFAMQSEVAEERSLRIKELMSKESLKEFEDELISILNMLYHEEHSVVGADEMCKQAVHYIEEHYMDTELSVSMLGEILETNSAYLSKVFKKKYDVTILNYIAQIRIRMAKEAMADMDKNIKDIAEECGFLSSNVFIKTFKKLEGMTPGMYRDLMSNKK